MKSEISKIAQAPGVVAIFKTTPEDTEYVDETGGTDLSQWRPVLEATTQVLSHTGEPEVKVALDKHSIVVQRSGDVIIGVVVVKSHPVVKPLKRMIRRCFRNCRS